MSDIASFGFAVDTAPLNAADAALERLGKTAAGVEAIINKMSANVSSAFAKVPSSLSGRAGGVASSSGSGGGGESPIARQTKEMSSFEKQADALRTKLDPLAAAHLKMSDAVGQYSRLAAAGLITQKEMTGGVHLASEAFREAEKEIRKHAGGMQFSTNQAAELQHVFRALTDEVAAGGNIFRALAMESGRLEEIFGSSLNITGRLATGFGALMSPIGLATAGVAAFGAVATAAAISYENTQARLQRAVEGTGRAAGLTAAQLGTMADVGARAGNMGFGEARGIASGFAQAGLPGNMISSLITATPSFSRFTDQDNAAGGAQLANDFRDPLAGVKDLDKTFGFLNDRLLGTIEDLKASGDLEGARRVELDAFNAALKMTTDDTWAAGDALREMKRWAGSVWEGLGQGVNHVLGGDEPPEQRLKRFTDMLPSTFDSPFAVGNLSKSYVQSQIDRARHEIDVKTDPAAAQRESQANDLSKLAGPLVKALLPEMTREQTYANNMSLLGSLVSNPTALNDMKLPPSAIQQAYGREAVMQDANRPAAQQRQDYDLRMAAADAFSVGEKAVVEARRAELAVLRETGDVTRAATAAQMTMNEAIAKGNSDADDRLTKAKQDFGLVGLSPYQRAMQELKNKYEGDGGIFARDEVTSSRALDDPNIKKDIGGASKLENAAIDAAMTIHSAGDRLAAALDGVATKMVGAGPGASPYGILQPFTGKAAGATATAPMMAMMQAYVQAGYSPAAAAGFVAGTSMESGTSLDPNASNGSHIGIAQWDRARWGQVQSLLGEGAGTRGGQIIASLNELRGSESRAGSMLAGSDSVLGGVIASDAYERPGDAEAARRRDTAIARGNALYTAYSGSAAPMTIHPALQAVAPLTPDMLGKNHQAYADNQAAVNKQFTSADPTLFGTPLGDANRSLDTQRAVLKMQADTFGQSAAAIKGASEAQQLWNRYTSEGITPTGALSDKIKAYGVDAAAVAKQQQDQLAQQQSIIGTADAFRGDFSSVFTSGFQSASQGKGFGAGLSSALDRIGQNLIGGGVNQITSGLFGKTGTPGGGILGNLFSSLPHLAAGTSDAFGGPTIVGEKGPELVQMPAHAQVISNEALGSMRSGSPNVSIGGHSIVVQGSADEKTVAMMDAKLAAANEQQWQRIVRDLPQIQQDSQQTS